MAPHLAPGKTAILIVEDEPLLRMAAVDWAEEAGFEALEAENADAAVLILVERLDIRIVFTDIDMPGSMDRIKLAKVIRGRWPPIHIILTSGYRKVSVGDLPERCVFIPKPYAPDHVVATLRQLAAP